MNKIFTNCELFTLYQLLFLLDKQGLSDNWKLITKATLSYKPCDVEKIIKKQNAVCVYVNLLGLGSLNGELDQRYVALVLSMKKAKREPMLDLLNIFNQRIIELFYKSVKTSLLCMDEIELNYHKFISALYNNFGQKEQESNRFLATLSLNGNFNIHSIKTYINYMIKPVSLRVEYLSKYIGNNSPTLGLCSLNALAIGRFILVPGSLLLVKIVVNCVQKYKTLLPSAAKSSALIQTIKERLITNLPIKLELILEKTLLNTTYLNMQESRLGFDAHLGQWSGLCNSFVYY